MTWWEWAKMRVALVEGVGTSSGDQQLAIWLLVAIIASCVGCYAAAVAYHAKRGGEVETLARIIIGFCSYGCVVFVSAILMPAWFPVFGPMWLGVFVSLAGFLHQTMQRETATTAAQTALELKTQATWDFIWRRATLEKETLRLNINDVLIQNVFAPLMPRLGEMGLQYQDRTDEALGAVIEREMGEYLARSICPQIQAPFGACLVCAVEFARERAHG